MKGIFLKEVEGFQKSYKKSFKNILILSILSFITCYLLSFAMADTFITYTKNIAESIADNMTEGIGKKIEDLDGAQTFLLIFWNNLKVTTTIILLGIIPFYRLSTFFTTIQFVIIGTVFGGLSAMGHNVMNALIFSFLPHAIFELTALVYCAAIGNFINRNIFKKVFSRNKKDNESMKKIVKQASQSYIFFMIPLLCFAALIEAFITSRLSHIFL